MAGREFIIVLCLTLVATSVYGCEDIDSQCQRMAEQGDCDSNKAFMVENCRKTCNWCPTVTVCEGDDRLISCPDPGQGLRILSATYGRKDDITCPHMSIYTTNCSAPDAYRRVSQVCNGRQFCHLSAYDNFGPDPCHGTYKYLQVEYVCQECDDYYGGRENCQTMKSKGECTDSWTARNCFMTCSECHYSECENSWDDLLMCDYWAMRGECEVNAKWMFRNCPMSCRVCTEADNPLSPVRAFPNVNVDICEGSEQKISCDNPEESLRILSAFYGRRDVATCPHETAANFTKECRAEGVLSRIKSVCDGRMFCHVGAYDNLGPDPCVGIYKYLQIEYTCTACEDKPEMENTPGMCRKWADEENCGSPRDGPFMDTYCYQTCSNCHQSECVNPHGDDSSCDYWALKGECQANKGWMEDECPMSCRTCDGEDFLPPPVPDLPCENSGVVSDARCEGWAARGECLKNPNYMYQNCYIGCTRCDNDDTIDTLVCEGEDMVLKCEGGRRIQLLEAFYGRSETDVCSNPQDKDLRCTGPEFFQKVQNECDGHSECTLPVTIDNLGDPCFGTYKYATATYRCHT